jgi:hypothetical protein
MAGGLKQIREVRRAIVGLELHEMDVLIRRRRRPDAAQEAELAAIAEERQSQLKLLDKYESRT